MLIAAALIAAFILVACDPPTEFPEPLNDAACWELVGEPIPFPPPSPFDPVSFWEWDGESETATYYSYGCGEEPVLTIAASSPDAGFSSADGADTQGGEEVCSHNVYIYNRICDVPEEPVTFACNVSDGSLNAYHCGRPVAIYAGSLEVWGIDPATGKGELAFELSDAQIAEVGIPDAEPALIAEGINPFTQAAIHVFRLPTGEFQLNTWYVGGKPYAVKWAEGDTFATNLLW